MSRPTRGPTSKDPTVDPATIAQFGELRKQCRELGIRSVIGLGQLDTEDLCPNGQVPLQNTLAGL
jgi:hypothetical protein